MEKFTRNLRSINLLCIHMVFIGIIRYRYPVMPILIMFCGYAVAVLCRKISNYNSKI